MSEQFQLLDAPEEDLLHNGVPADPAEDGDDGSEQPQERRVMPVQRQPLEHLQGRLAAGTTDGPDDERVVGGV